MRRRLVFSLPVVLMLAVLAIAPGGPDAARAASGPVETTSPMSGNGHNVSFDGRLFIVRSGPDAPSGGWFLRVLRPERVTYRAGGVPVLADAFSPPVLIQPFANGENALAICEENAASTPYRCDAGGAASAGGAYACYDLVILDSNAYPDQHNGLRRRRLKLWIANAGTRDAALHRHEWQSGYEPLRAGARDLRGIEPTVTRDGRLLVWQGHPDNDGKIDILMYATNDAPCAAGGWDGPHVITHLHVDPRARGRYPLAERQLRAADGTPFADGALFRGAYPWVFPDGDAINFTAANMPCRGTENPPGCGPRRNALSVIGYPTNWGIAHIDGDVNPSTTDTVRLFFSSPGATTFPQLPVSGGVDVWPFFGSNTSNYAEVVFDDALDGRYAGVWHMNESIDRSGNLDRGRTPDTSGYFNTGVVHGATFPDTNNGLFGKALVFGGDGAHVEVRHDASLDPVNAISVEMRLRPASPASCNASDNARVLLAKGGTSGTYSLILENDMTLQARVRTGGVQRAVRSTRPLVVGEWAHVGFTYDAATGDMRIFTDGAQVGRASHPAMTLDAQAAPLRFGGPGGARPTCPNGDGAFHGAIDEVRISRAVRDLTFAPRPGNAAAFVDQWVPAAVEAGSTFVTHVTLRNLGTTAWSNETMHRLGAQAPMDNTRWGTGRVSLPRKVQPGEVVTIVATLTAPSELGDHPMQWRMVHEGAEWFGPETPLVSLRVGAPGTVPDAGPPPSLDAGTAADAGPAPRVDGGVAPARDSGTSTPMDAGATPPEMDAGGEVGGEEHSGGCAVSDARAEFWPLAVLGLVGLALWRRRRAR
ncbi:MAG: hypothetical protein KF901_04900 [Myxococcales bacterium]|nr:hypothetical protein [Myxococcales bacterium]